MRAASASGGTDDVAESPRPLATNLLLRADRPMISCKAASTGAVPVVLEGLFELPVERWIAWTRLGLSGSALLASFGRSLLRSILELGRAAEPFRLYHLCRDACADESARSPRPKATVRHPWHRHRDELGSAVCDERAGDAFFRILCVRQSLRRLAMGLAWRSGDHGDASIPIGRPCCCGSSSGNAARGLAWC